MVLIIYSLLKINNCLWNEWIQETKKLHKNEPKFLKDFTSDKHEPSYNSHLTFLPSLGQWLFLLQVLFQLKIYFCHNKYGNDIKWRYEFLLQ